MSQSINQQNPRNNQPYNQRPNQNRQNRGAAPGAGQIVQAAPAQRQDNAARNENKNRGKFTPSSSSDYVNGTLSKAVCRYKLSAKACEVYRKYHSNLLIGEGRADGSCLHAGTGVGHKDHPHPLGATQRKEEHLKAVFNYGAGLQIHEIGGTQGRPYSWYEYGRDEQLHSVMERYHMTIPGIDYRDDLRAITQYQNIKMACENHNSAFPTRAFQLTETTGICQCAGSKSRWESHYRWEKAVADAVAAGNVGPLPFNADAVEITCAACLDKSKKMVYSLDSAYYDDVLGEVFEQCIRRSSFGIVTVNDYQTPIEKALEKITWTWKNRGDKKTETIVIKAEATENAADTNGSVPWQCGVPEAVMTCEVKSGLVNKTFEAMNLVKSKEDLKIRVDVQGNPMAYEHKVLRFGKKPMFMYNYTAANSTKYYMVFEEMSHFLNAEIPYRTYRITPTLQSRYSDVSRYEILDWNTRWMTELDIQLIVYANEVDEQCFVTSIQKKIDEKKKDREARKTKKKENKVKLALADFGEDQYYDKVNKIDDKDVNLEGLYEEQAGQWEFVKYLKCFFDKREHSFRVRVIDGELYLKLSAHRKRLLTGWLGFTEPNKSLTAMAKLTDVIKCYTSIGLKKLTASVLQVGVTLQRDEEKKTGAEIKLFRYPEALTIARYIRKSQEVRYEKILTSVGAAPAKSIC